jgi:hypothetical protein
MRLIKLFLVFVLCNLFVACSTYAPLREQNRKNIQLIKIGDTENSAISKMGVATGKGAAGDMTNPYKRESVKLGSSVYDIWYYYTEEIGNKNWEEGMTPVVFLNGRVEAIGWRGMERLGLDSNTTLTIRRR